jgi:hypothetical protein
MQVSVAARSPPERDHFVTPPGPDPRFYPVAFARASPGIA